MVAVQGDDGVTVRSGSRALDAAVAAIGHARPFVADAWEAAAVAESLGYTDARVQREFGCPDTRAFGELVFERLAQQQGPPPASAARQETPAAGSAGRIGTPALLYLVPWLGVLAIERTAIAGGPSLSIALMLSLVLCGGFVEAIRRRADFHLAQDQPYFARVTSAYFARVCALLIVAAALAGVAVGWFFDLAAWPRLVLWADRFLLFGAVWLACGVLSVRHEPWRLAVAYGAGAIAYGGARWAGSGPPPDVVALLGVVAVAALQMPRLFGPAASPDPARTPVPRMSVVLAGALPVAMFAGACFAFLFADRLAVSAAVAALAGAPALPADYRLAVDVAVVPLFLALGAVGYAGARFSRRVTDAIEVPVTGAAGAVARMLGGSHARAVGLVAVAYIVGAVVVDLAMYVMAAAIAPAVWGALITAQAGYLLVACGILNALVLSQLQRPWAAVGAFAGGVLVNVAVGYVLARAFGPAYATGGIIAGGLLLVTASSVAVHLALRRAHHAIVSV